MEKGYKYKNRKTGSFDAIAAASKEIGHLPPHAYSETEQTRDYSNFRDNHVSVRGLGKK